MQMGKKIFVIYPGRFHPFHKGHKSVYDYLSTKYGGSNVYITTTDKIELPKSPFNFDEKSTMMSLTGIPLSKIIKVVSNYNVNNLMGQIPIDLDRDSLIFAVSEKDMTEDPRFSKFTKKDGSPSYLQPLTKKLDKLEPAIKHGYIDTTPTTDFTVLGKQVRSASELRKQYVTLTPKQKKLFITDLFGKYSDVVKQILDTKLRAIANQLTEKQKQTLKRIIVGIIKEDEAKINAAKQEVDKITVDLKNATENLKKIELAAAEESLKQAQEALKSAKTPEEKKTKEIDVKLKQSAVDNLKD